MSERLVGSPAFKAGGMGDPCPAGSIPVHLRHQAPNAAMAPPPLSAKRRTRLVSEANGANGLDAEEVAGAGVA